MTSAGTWEYPAPEQQPAEQQSLGRSEPRSASVRPLVVVIAGQLLLGVAIGLIWLAWAPRTVSYLIPGNGNAVIVIPDESENQIAGDGRFLLLCAVAGLLAALLAWFGARAYRGPLMLSALGLGALLSSALASFLGGTFSPGSNTGALRTAIHPTLTLHATPLFLAQSFVAVLVYTLLVGLSSDPEFAAPPVPAQPAGAPADTALSSLGGKALRPDDARS
jgi:hypothetical protein